MGAFVCRKIGHKSTEKSCRYFSKYVELPRTTAEVQEIIFQGDCSQSLWNLEFPSKHEKELWWWQSTGTGRPERWCGLSLETFKAHVDVFLCDLLKWSCSGRWLDSMIFRRPFQSLSFCESGEFHENSENSTLKGTLLGPSFKVILFSNFYLFQIRTSNAVAGSVDPRFALHNPSACRQQPGDAPVAWRHCSALSFGKI